MKFFLIMLLVTFAVLNAVKASEPLEIIARTPAPPIAGEEIRGITLAPIEDQRLGSVGYGSEPCAVALEEISALGTSWISITPFGRMNDINSTDIQHYFEIPVEQNMEMIRATATQARKIGLKVAIIPHIYIMSGRWRGNIDPGDAKAWARWFSAYEIFVLRFARLAREIDADLFSIGVEFKSSTNFYADAWRRLIAKVREVYPGPLTYSANWDEVDQVPFWDDLDLIGINAFWPLAGQPGDGYPVMKTFASKVADELEGLSFFYDRLVLFTEVGVKSAADSALAPWEWPENCGDTLKYSEQYQAEAYDAVFEIFTRKSWFAGMFIWKYFSDPFDETQEAITGFSPKGKSAEAVLSQWYHVAW